MTRNTIESQRYELFVTAKAAILPHTLRNHFRLLPKWMQWMCNTSDVAEFCPFIVQWNSLMDDKIVACAVATANNATTQQHDQTHTHTHTGRYYSLVFLQIVIRTWAPCWMGKVWVFVASDHFVELNTCSCQWPVRVFTLLRFCCFALFSSEFCCLWPLMTPMASTGQWWLN